MDRNCQVSLFINFCIIIWSYLWWSLCSDKTSGKFCVYVCEIAIERCSVEQLLCVFVRGPWFHFQWQLYAAHQVFVEYRFIIACSDSIFVSSVSKNFHYNFIYEQNYLTWLQDWITVPLRSYLVKVRSDNITIRKRIMYWSGYWEVFWNKSCS